MKNYYQVLGISTFSTDEEIDKAIELASAFNTVTMKDLQEIKMYLKNPGAKKIYDLQLIEFAAANPTGVKKDIRLSNKVIRDLIKATSEQADEPVKMLLPDVDSPDFAQHIEDELSKSKADIARKKVMILDGTIAFVLMLLGMILLYVLKLKLYATIGRY